MIAIMIQIVYQPYLKKPSNLITFVIMNGLRKLFCALEPDALRITLERYRHLVRSLQRDIPALTPGNILISVTVSLYNKVTLVIQAITPTIIA